MLFCTAMHPRHLFTHCFTLVAMKVDVCVTASATRGRAQLLELVGAGHPRHGWVIWGCSTVARAHLRRGRKVRGGVPEFFTICGQQMKERQIERERETERQRKRHRDRERQRQRERHTQRQKQKKKEKEK